PPRSPLFPYTTLFRSGARTPVIPDHPVDGTGGGMIPAGENAFHGIYPSTILPMHEDFTPDWHALAHHTADCVLEPGIVGVLCNGDRKSTRLNSSHVAI